MGSPESHQHPELRQCNQCFSDIDRRALVCKSCGSIQNRLKATAIYVAGIASLATIMTSAITYLYGQYNEYLINQDPLRILDYTYEVGGVFLNRSKDPLYLRSISMLTEDRHTLYDENIQMTIPGKSVMRYKIPKIMALYPRSSFPTQQEEWRKTRDGGSSECFKVTPILNRYYDEHLREKVEARISFISTREGTYHEKTVSMKAALLLKDKPDCLKYGNPNSLFP